MQGNLKDAILYASKNPDSDFAKQLTQVVKSGQVDAQAQQLGIDLAPIKGAGTQPQVPQQDFLQKAGSVVNSIFPGKNLGTAIGNSVDALKGLVTGDKQRFQAGANANSGMAGKVAGDVAQSVALPASFAVGGGPILSTAAKYGGLSALQGAGQSLSEGNGAGKVAKDTAVSGTIGAGTGLAFGLLGKGINAIAEKAGPSALSFTSGVPKLAIEQASVSPSTAKEGLKMSVNEVRSKAISSLQGLHNELNAEFKAGSQTLGNTTLPNAQEISSNLVQKSREIAEQFKVGVTPSAEGLISNFDKSSIVKAGEQSAVNKALQTISTWDDFSEKGLQALNQRVNALKNFDESGVKQSSAIVGKIHNAIGQAIKENSPILSTLNENYSKNRKVLNEIGNVIGSKAKEPTQIQASVNRLDGIFKENKDEYINVIKQLGERSGVDYLSLLAGGEFQKVLPGFVRGLGGGGAVGVGASVLNPYLLLLAPLFSPRGAGAIVRNAPSVARTTSALTRAASTQAIPRVKSALESKSTK